jgi:hypothetical protein
MMDATKDDIALLLSNAVICVMTQSAIRYLIQHHEDLWILILRLSLSCLRNDSGAINKQPNSTTFVMRCALVNIDRLLRGVRIVGGVSVAQKTNTGGCAACFGGRSAPPPPQQSKESCSCAVIHLHVNADVDHTIDSIAQTLLPYICPSIQPSSTAPVIDASVVVVSSPSPPPLLDEYLIILCINITAALLPVFQINTLLQIPTSLFVLIQRSPSIAVSVSNLLTKLAFIRLPNETPHFREKPFVDSLGCLWNSVLLLQHDDEKNTNEKHQQLPFELTIFQSLVNFRIFAQFTDLPYETMLRGKTKDTVVAFMKQHIPSSPIAALTGCSAMDEYHRTGQPNTAAWDYDDRNPFHNSHTLKAAIQARKRKRQMLESVNSQRHHHANSDGPDNETTEVIPPLFERLDHVHHCLSDIRSSLLCLNPMNRPKVNLHIRTIQSVLTQIKDEIITDCDEEQ